MNLPRIDSIASLSTLRLSSFKQQRGVWVPYGAAKGVEFRIASILRKEWEIARSRALSEYRSKRVAIVIRETLVNAILERIGPDEAEAFDREREKLSSTELPELIKIARDLGVTEPTPESVKLPDMEEVETCLAMSSVLAQFVLKDWRGVVDSDGNEVKYTTALGERLLSDEKNVAILLFVVRVAGDTTRFLEEQRRGDAGN